jgi:carbonic anhydrase
MTLLDDIMSYNKEFVETKKYQQFQTTKFPNKRLVVVSCMDTRLVELLPNAMNLKNGDVKIIKNAGAIVSHPFGSVMRSILLAIYELNADEVCVVGHHDCGMYKMDAQKLLNEMIEKGVSRDTIHTLQNAGIDLNSWLKGFDFITEGIEKSVQMIKNHPLLPNNIPIHGLLIDPHTGKLEIVVNGYTGEVNCKSDEDWQNKKG